MNGTLYRITWKDGLVPQTTEPLRKSRWFKDKFAAQDLILKLQERGIAFQLTKHDGKTGDRIQ